MVKKSKRIRNLKDKSIFLKNNYTNYLRAKSNVKSKELTFERYLKRNKYKKSIKNRKDNFSIKNKNIKKNKMKIMLRKLIPRRKKVFFKFKDIKTKKAKKNYYWNKKGKKIKKIKNLKYRVFHHKRLSKIFNFNWFNSFGHVGKTILFASYRGYIARKFPRRARDLKASYPRNSLKHLKQPVRKYFNKYLCLMFSMRQIV